MAQRRQFRRRDRGQAKSSAKAPSYTSVFAKSLIKHAERDDRIVAITAAMPSGTGLNLFEEKFPKRTFDVGIAEQHAVSFAAGLATEGMKPFAAIYSTFLQRAYDQIVHDVAIQKLPVRFAIDRAGLVGNDGQTHAGSFDVTYLGCLPGSSSWRPATRPISRTWSRPVSRSTTRRRRCGFRRRRVRGTASRDRRAFRNRPRPHHARGHRIALLSLGGRLHECLKAADELAPMGCRPRSPTRVSRSRSIPTW